MAQTTLDYRIRRDDGDDLLVWVTATRISRHLKIVTVTVSYANRPWRLPSRTFKWFVGHDTSTTNPELRWFASAPGSGIETKHYARTLKDMMQKVGSETTRYLQGLGA